MEERKSEESLKKQGAALAEALGSKLDAIVQGGASRSAPAFPPTPPGGGSKSPEAIAVEVAKILKDQVPVGRPAASLGVPPEDSADSLSKTQAAWLAQVVSPAGSKKTVKFTDLSKAAVKV